MDGVEDLELLGVDEVENFFEVVIENTANLEEFKTCDRSSCRYPTVIGNKPALTDRQQLDVLLLLKNARSSSGYTTAGPADPNEKPNSREAKFLDVLIGPSISQRYLSFLRRGKSFVNEESGMEIMYLSSLIQEARKSRC